MGRIFIVEDDAQISRVYERAFRMAHHEIEVSGSGEVAWKALSAAKVLPSVIIIDIMLPNMSGTDLLELINKDKRFNNTPVVVLTNSSYPGLERQLQTAGADMYLVKVDHEPKDIVSKVENLISKFQ